MHVGQKAVLRFSAFNQRTTPEIDGEVIRISADVTQDQRTGATLLHGPHSRCRRRARAPRRAAAVPGMPVEAFIQTASARSSYLVKPLGDQIARAFRER